MVVSTFMLRQPAVNPIRASFATLPFLYSVMLPSIMMEDGASAASTTSPSPRTWPKSIPQDIAESIVNVLQHMFLDVILGQRATRDGAPRRADLLGFPGLRIFHHHGKFPLAEEVHPRAVGQPEPE